MENSSKDHFTWRLWEVFEKNPHFQLVILNGNHDLRLPHHILATLWERADLRLATDGAANLLRQLSQDLGRKARDSGATGVPQNPLLAAMERRHLDVIIGDYDSITPETIEYWGESVEQIRSHDQDSTDLGKAIAYIRDRRPETDIVVAGSLAGRVDHGIGIIHHLYRYRTPQSQLFLVTEQNLSLVLPSGFHTLWLEPDQWAQKTGQQAPDVSLKKPFGQICGLLPLHGLCSLTTSGLRWDVKDWETVMGGNVSTSNEVASDTSVEIHTTGPILFTLELQTHSNGS